MRPGTVSNCKYYNIVLPIVSTLRVKGGVGGLINQNTFVLSDYQQEGVNFLVSRKRAILGDDMGLGKSATAIRACNHVNATSVLVVTKKSLITNWLTEIERWDVQQASWDVTNYEQLIYHPGHYPASRYGVLIVDEAAAIRNRKSKRSKAIRKLARGIPYVWLLTGTPVVNGPWDLWALLNAIDHKKYSSFWRFVNRHIITASNGWGTEFIGTRDERALAEELTPVMLRRTKEILNLPPLSFEDVYVSMNKQQERIYNKLRKEFIAEVGDKVVVAPSVVALLTRLRQVVCSPALLGGDDTSAKTDALTELLEDLTPTHKVLVFSAFAEYVKLLLSRLSAYNPTYIIGSLSAKQRNQAVEKFNNDSSCRILIGTIGAMGEGLNLYTADVVIFADHEWVPAANEQAWSRAYRRGQTKPVHVIKLITKDTVEQYVQRKLDEKASRIEVIEHAIKCVLKENKHN